MHNFIEQCIDEKDCNHQASSSALEHFFKILEDSSCLSDADKKVYRLFAYIDASFGVHMDGSSRTGGSIHYKNGRYCFYL